jgi:hypothetical protein
MREHLLRGRADVMRGQAYDAGVDTVWCGFVYYAPFLRFFFCLFYSLPPLFFVLFLFFLFFFSGPRLARDLSNIDAIVVSVFKRTKDCFKYHEFLDIPVLDFHKIFAPTNSSIEIHGKVLYIAKRTRNGLI